MRTLEWIDTPDGGLVRMVDQTRLPNETIMLDCADLGTLAEAIRKLRIRGAPAIGCAAAQGIALVASRSRAESVPGLVAELQAARDVLAATRPTAVNLFWALERMMARAEALLAAGVERKAFVQALLQEAVAITEDDLERCRRIGKHGAELIPEGANILTHCNAGALATAGYGTALGVIRAAHDAGKRVHVWVDETRPLLQGARLTAWELQQEGIPCTLITDNMAGYLMQQGKVDCVVVGADRIAANGDAANKIGTYAVAVLAHHHSLPFYVAAPFSTVDLALASGQDIPIEERDHDEVALLAHLATQPACPAGVSIYNPAFDPTPSDLIAAIVTEVGVIRPPYRETLAAAAPRG
ncbi:MAG: S-methyl-5-thioribose-1-phosphate isomerase [Armatimonadetes bacterium]|nr:S-methyl-5-thioribose-1-phosphate isomerase [Armatimonadota bacterium]